MKLVDNAIHLHLCFPHQVRDSELLQSYISLLSPGELTRMSRFSFAQDRHRYLVTRALIRTVLSTYYPVCAAKWEFTANRYGKPVLADPYSELPIRFNLSHTRGLILCGVVLDHEIGVDVEDSFRPVSSSGYDLSRYFSNEEIAVLDDLPDSQKKERFFDYWTLKEAYVKARGMGLSMPLDKFGFLFKANEFHEFWIHPELKDKAENWQFRRMSFKKRRYRVAVAVNCKEDCSELRVFETVPMRECSLRSKDAPSC